MGATRNLVDVQNVSKKFCRNLKRSFYYASKDIVRELMLKPGMDTLRPHEFWALRNVSFQLKAGESMGLVGPNGSGKTTMLRILSGCIKPTRGTLSIRGRTAPLIALGSGFSPVLTGRENVYINMSILGLTRKQINERYESVLDFADIGDVLDAPVRTYSSGMAARLGFACAIHTEPDLLLIDEVLAVGDMKFRIKCYQKLGELREKGTCFVLVSHNPIPILSNCDSSIYIKNGKLITSGKTDDVVEIYERDLLTKTKKSTEVNTLSHSNSGVTTSSFRIKNVRFEGENGQPLEEIESGKKAFLVAQCESEVELPEISLGLYIKDLSWGKEIVQHMESGRDDIYFSCKPGTFSLRLEWPHCGLKPGQYSAKIFVTRGRHYTLLDAVESFRFSVKAPRLMTQCAYYQPRSWRMESSLEN